MIKQKKCPGCNLVLPIESFGIHNGRKNGVQSLCKQCKKEYDKNRYKKDIKKQVNSTDKNRKNLKEEFNTYKKTLKCEICGESRWYVLEFHHINPKEKEGEISDLLRSCSTNKLWKETKKCIPLCANCHRELHFKEKNNA